MDPPVLVFTNPVHINSSRNPNTEESTRVLSRQVGTPTTEDRLCRRIHPPTTVLNSPQFSTVKGGQNNHRVVLFLPCESSPVNFPDIIRDMSSRLPHFPWVSPLTSRSPEEWKSSRLFRVNPSSRTLGLVLSTHLTDGLPSRPNPVPVRHH